MRTIWRMTTTSQLWKRFLPTLTASLMTSLLPLFLGFLSMNCCKLGHVECINLSSNSFFCKFSFLGHFLYVGFPFKGSTFWVSFPVLGSLYYVFLSCFPPELDSFATVEVNLALYIMFHINRLNQLRKKKIVKF